MSLIETYNDLQKTRDQDEQWKQDNAPPLNAAGIRKWREERQASDAQVQAKEDEFSKALMKGTPEELNTLQSSIAETHAAMLKSLEQKHDGLMVPPEARHDHEHGLSQLPLHERLVARFDDQGAEEAMAAVASGSLRDRVLQKREAEQGEEAGRHSGRMQPNWGAYATTSEEMREMKQLEDDQNALTRELGRRPNNEEVQKYQQERQEKAQHQAESQHRKPDENDQGQSA
jgi:hypothetical protein